MIPFQYYPLRTATGIPRESGDDPATADLTADVAQYSPRERG